MAQYWSMLAEIRAHLNKGRGVGKKQKRPERPMVAMLMAEGGSADG